MRFPVRRFLQGTKKTETPSNSLGVLQWVLSRPMYRFHVFDLAQVPSKNRSQALRLELNQWTPFTNSDYYVGWHDKQALVWCWDADKIKQAIKVQGLKPQRARILPESVLQTPIESGLALCRCHEGFEGQFWREAHLRNSRWWPQLPTQEEWLMFQRDAGISSDEQHVMPPEPCESPLNTKPWVNESGSADDRIIQLERLSMALGMLFLLAPTLWYGFGLYKVQRSSALLHAQQIQLRQKADPILEARSKALSLLERVNELRALSPYPEQLSLMAKIAQVLPRDKSYIKDWNFELGQLKITLASPVDISTTLLIGALQQVGQFKNVKALPGRDPKIVQFQMDVIGE